MTSFFKIRMGIVAVSRALDDGRRPIVAVRAPGDCVGYLDNNGKYAFEGEALTDVEACAFDRRGFDAFAGDHPDLAAAVTEALSSALKQTGQAMLVLGQLKSTERVAHFLCEIDALYRQRHIGGRLVLHMSRGEIGDYLGLTIETVSRSMGKLKKRGLIGLVGADGVVVLEDAKLREVGKVTARPRRARTPPPSSARPADRAASCRGRRGSAVMIVPRRSSRHMRAGLRPMGLPWMPCSSPTRRAGSESRKSTTVWASLPSLLNANDVDAGMPTISSRSTKSEGCRPPGGGVQTGASARHGTAWPELADMI